MPEEKAPSSGPSCQHRRCIFAPASRRIFAPALTAGREFMNERDPDVRVRQARRSIEPLRGEVLRRDIAPGKLCQMPLTQLPRPRFREGSGWALQNLALRGCGRWGYA